MDRLKAWLGEGLILVPTVLLLGFLLFTLSFRVDRLSDLVEILPLETEAFFVVNMNDFETSGSPVDESYLQEFVGVPLDELTWFKRDLGVAWIDGNTVHFLEMESKAGAEDFFGTLVEGEELTSSSLDEDVRCYEIESLCYLFSRNFLVFSTSPEALAAVDAPGPKLESSEQYQNVRGRLGHLESGFIYVDLQTVQGLFPQSLFLQSVLEIFPAWGASVRMESEGWYAESFTAVNKDLIGGAYFRPSEKYEQKFLRWTQNFAWEWGGQDLASQTTRMQEIFSKLGSTGELIFTSSLNAQVKALFGEEVKLDDYLTVLGGETYMGWTSPDEFLLILELEEEEDRLRAQELEGAFVHHYSFKNSYATEQGEIKMEAMSLQEIPKEYEGTFYQLVVAGDEVLAAIAFTEEAVIGASTEKILQDTLDRRSGRQSGRSLEDFSVLLPGSNEIWILNSAFLPEGNILKTRLSTLTRLMSTRKIFDDGIFTRTSLLK